MCSNDTGLALQVDLHCHQDGFPCVSQDDETGMGVRVDGMQMVATVWPQYQQPLIWSEYVQIK